MSSAPAYRAPVTGLSDLLRSFRDPTIRPDISDAGDGLSRPLTANGRDRSSSSPIRPSDKQSPINLSRTIDTDGDRPHNEDMTKTQDINSTATFTKIVVAPGSHTVWMASETIIGREFRNYRIEDHRSGKWIETGFGMIENFGGTWPVK